MTNISIIAKKFDLTDALKEKIHTDFSILDKYHLNIVNAKITLQVENAKQKRNVAEVHVNIAQISTIIIKQVDKDIYKAIDVALEKLEHKLSNIHKRQVEHKSPPVDMEFEIEKDEELEVIHEDMTILKPLELEDAIDLLNSSDQLFLVFLDNHSNKRVVYKRKDNNIGLY